MSNSKVYFDPSDLIHKKDFAYFLKHNKWKGGCHYVLEQPYVSIPEMIREKLLNHYLKMYIEEA